MENRLREASPRYLEQSLGSQFIERVQIDPPSTITQARTEQPSSSAHLGNDVPGQESGLVTKLKV